MTEPSAGWKQLLPPGPRYRRPGAYPIPAYSEFMPPPRLGRRACGARDRVLFADRDPWGWHVTEYEEAFELLPGLAHLAGELLHALQRLGRGKATHGIGRLTLRHNPFWPEPLAGAGAPPQERFVALLPLALARTQDDKGRVRWTVFGASEQGPARPFWRGFFTAPGREVAAGEGLAFCRRLVAAAAGASRSGALGAGSAASAEPSAATAEAATRELLAAGFRILTGGLAAAAEAGGTDFSDEGPLPSWTLPLIWSGDTSLTGVRYLLSFRPFGQLPESVRGAYLAGDLHLLPFPGSLIFWGAPRYLALARDLPLALQIPLLNSLERSEDPHHLRVPQSGWLHEPRSGQAQPAAEHGPIRNTFRRTHRWGRVERHQDELAVAGQEDRMAHVLFSAAADDLGLYGKPMARNAQIWTVDYDLLLDGPRAGRADLAAAASRLAAGGTFGYRFLYPAMRVGEHEVYWHRLLAALPEPGGGQAALIDGAPLGYLTAYPVESPDLTDPVELWPRLLARPAHLAAIEGLRGCRFVGAVAAKGSARAGGTAEIASGDGGVKGGRAAAKAAGRAPASQTTAPIPADVAGYRRAVNNSRKLLDAWQLLGQAPLPPSFARALLKLPKGETLDSWLEALAEIEAPALSKPARRPAPAAIAPSPRRPAGAPAATSVTSTKRTSRAPLGAPADPGATPPPLTAELRARIALPQAPSRTSPTGAAGAAATMQATPAKPVSGDARSARAAAASPRRSVAVQATDPVAPEPLTLHTTARRRFEEAYWRRIAFLSEGRFINKDNADCVRDPITQAKLVHHQRDLDALAEYLLAHYRRLIASRSMAGRAAVGDLPFQWRTDFDFGWSGGWLGNQQGDLEERNVMVAIPGRDRSRAVIMADHYDTAYMEDSYGYQHGGHGPRLAAAGADDNHSATVALMLAAPIFLEMSRAGQLGCDIWLVHLTGEEFPSDCLGARHLTQSLVEGTLRLRTRPPGAGGRERGEGGEQPRNLDLQKGWTDLSATRVQGVYVLDMVAHNNDRDRDVFQICPGTSGESMWLALQAHLANHAWNRLAPGWNRRARRGCKRGRRSADGRTLPALARHPELQGEVRPPIDPHSTLYNTDGQIFSDAGVPVVLFMENYDINRHGYHDSHDTMANIDLDYGAAVAAIAIETVARAATEPAPRLD